MSTIRLDIADLTVFTFDTTAFARNAAPLASDSDSDLGSGYDTTDHICMAMTWLAEDCFGATAGCTPGSETCIEA
jgi:hypothetical protein